MNYTHLFSPVLILISIFALSSCSDDLAHPEQTTDGTLSIDAVLMGYDDGESRTIDIDYTTSFTDGDDMGILAIRDGKVLSDVCNIRAFYNGSNWATDKPIPNYSGAKYIAYSPYKSDLQTDNITTVDDITAQLSVPEQGTYDKAEYLANDWLVAGKSSIKEDVLKFTFTHAFGMLEIILPRTVYKMSQKDGNSTLPDYYIANAESYYISDGGFKMCETSPNAYRCLVPPNQDIHVYGGYKSPDGKIHDFTYKLEANALQGGECRSVVVDEQKVVNFSYEQGDFFLADGSLVEKDAKLTDEQKEQCIGVVLYTNSSSVVMGESEKNALNDMGVGTHGYVVALRDVFDPTTGETLSGKMWGPLIDIEGLENGTGLEAYLTDYSGLDKTMEMVAASQALEDYSKYAAYDVALFNQTVPAPSHTTGWFIPSIGQWIHMLQKFGNISLTAEDFNSHAWSDQALSFEYVFSKSSILTKVNNKFDGSGTYDAISGSYWTSDEGEAAYAFYVNFSSYAFDIFETHKGSGSKKIRCFLAF